MASIDLLTSIATRAIAGARVRPYGVAVGDLEVDFDAPRPIVVTRVLAACTGGAEDELWDLPVQTRILLALGISEISIAAPIDTRIACACGEINVIELATAELATFAEERRRAELVVEAEGLRALLRLPTGRDQLQWAQLPATGDVARAVFSQLVVEGVLTEALVIAADRLLSDADPLIEFELSSSCNACGVPLSRTVDLERVALTRLRYARRALLDQVDALASNYHWTEAAIGALPAWRRMEYAALIDARRR